MGIPSLNIKIHQIWFVFPHWTNMKCIICNENQIGLGFKSPLELQMKPICRWLRAPKTDPKADLWETSAFMKQTCKFHREIDPRTFLLSKHCTTIMIIISQFIEFSRFSAFGALLEIQQKTTTNQNLHNQNFCCDKFTGYDGLRNVMEWNPPPLIHSYICSLQQSVWSTIDMPFPAITHQSPPFSGQAPWCSPRLLQKHSPLFKALYSVLEVRKKPCNGTYWWNWVACATSGGSKYHFI